MGRAAMATTGWGRACLLDAAPMRTLVIILMLMAAGKVLAVEYLHRAAGDELVVNAYRTRALETCSREARRKGLATANWKADTPITLEIGNRGAAAFVWQVDNPAWSQRFRHPYLHVTGDQGGQPVQCLFDVIAGSAAVGRG